MEVIAIPGITILILYMGINVIRYRLIYLVLLVFLSSCLCLRPPDKYIKGQFSLCYSGSPTGLDTLIDINGIYRDKKLAHTDEAGIIYSVTSRGGDTVIEMMFFNDGVCALGNFSSELFANINNCNH